MHPILQPIKWAVKRTLGAFNLSIIRNAPPAVDPVQANFQPFEPPVLAVQAPFVPPADLADLAPYVQKMATTGEGTDACLDLGCLPVPVHYYSPIPDIKDLKNRNIWKKVSDLEGIDFNPENQLKFLLELGQKYGAECDWPLERTSNKYQFYINNNNFSFGCAAILHSMIRDFRPQRIIEIGSGNSSRVISAAITQSRDSGSDSLTEYIIVDPYPDEDALSGLPNLTHIEKERVELLNPDFFSQLGENDILFIDSGHTVKIGGDVTYLILQILPRLAPGVIVHFHDIPMPYEYPDVYYTNPAFRVFWTESYLLQAFLAFNNSFGIMLCMSYLMEEHLDKFREAFPMFNSNIHLAKSGSFWMRRKFTREGI